MEYNQSFRIHYEYSRRTRPLSPAVFPARILLWLGLAVLILGRRAGVCLPCRPLRSAATRRAGCSSRALGGGHRHPRQTRGSDHRRRESGRSFLRARICDGAGPAVADGHHAAFRQRRTLGDHGRGFAEDRSRTAHSGIAGGGQKRWRWRALAIGPSLMPTPAE